MFDVERVAKTIKTKRIEKNMTQGDLADKLFVSFQAVSNWERGNSMPDISKLENLCNVLEISVDELLGIGEKAEKKEQILSKGEKLSFKELYKIAEQVDEKYIKAVIEADNCEITDIEGFFELIEYLPDETVANVIGRVSSKKLKELSELIEDFGDEAQDAYVARCIEADELNLLLNNAEFFSRENLDFVIDYFINTGNADMLSEIYPYLEEYQLCRIVRALLESNAEEEKISEAYDYI